MSHPLYTLSAGRNLFRDGKLAFILKRGELSPVAADALAKHTAMALNAVPAAHDALRRLLAWDAPGKDFDYEAWDNARASLAQMEMLIFETVG